MRVINGKRIFLVIVTAMVFSLGLLGCTYGFPEGFDKDECIEKAEDIIEVVNTKNYAAVHALLRDDLEENVTAEDFKEAWDNKLDKIGAFEKFGNPVLSGEIDTETGEEFAMIVFYCYYEDGEAIYTIYFDSNMEMTSISMKLD